MKCDVKNMLRVMTDESPLNTAFRAFVISRCATDTYDTHTTRLTKMYFTHSV